MGTNNMSWEERKERFYKRTFYDKYVVFTYHPNKNGEIGNVEKLPTPNDYGWSWNPTSACIHTNCEFKFEINAYWDEYTEDEEFNPNNLERFKVFTNKEKADKYSEELKKHISTKDITLNDILKEIKKIDKYKNVSIVKGKRGFENLSDEYEVVLLDPMTYLKVYQGKYILINNCYSEYIIPHIDVIKFALKNGDYNWDFIEDLYHWNQYFLRNNNNF